MRIFLWIMLILNGLEVVTELALLGWKGYPRTVRYERWEDALGVGLSVTLAVLLIVLLKAA